MTMWHHYQFDHPFLAWCIFMPFRFHHIVTKLWWKCDLMFEHILYMSHYRHNFITFLLKWVCQIWHHSYNSVYLSWNCDENVMSGKKWKCILKFLFSTFLHYSYKMLCKEISEINFNLLLWFHTILYCELYSFLTGI